MPFVRTGGQLIYFAHVPKCGGSSVEAYMRARFGVLGMLDTRFLSRPEVLRWSRGSPQHVDRDTLDTLLPPALIDASFAVVRHPLARALSAYRFQRDREGSVAAGASFAEALPRMLETAARDPFAYDGHLRPQGDFVPEAAAVFHLEHGLDALVPWFDAVTGRREGPRHLGRENSTPDAGLDAGSEAGPAEAALVAEVYAQDFRRFGYSPGDPMPQAAPPAPDPGAAAARARAARPLRRLARRVGLRLLRLGNG